VLQVDPYLVHSPSFRLAADDAVAVAVPQQSEGCFAIPTSPTPTHNANPTIHKGPQRRSIHPERQSKGA
jgi:hypothetical protein